MADTDTLTETERKEIQALVQERDNLQEKIERLKVFISTEVDPTEEEGDPEIIEREKTLAVLHSLERKLEEINAALRAAEQGTYGICEVCGQPIDPARLEIVPEATMCVTCKSAAERRPRRY